MHPVVAASVSEPCVGPACSPTAGLGVNVDGRPEIRRLLQPVPVAAIMDEQEFRHIGGRSIR